MSSGVDLPAHPGAGVRRALLHPVLIQVLGIQIRPQA